MNNLDPLAVLLGCSARIFNFRRLPLHHAPSRFKPLLADFVSRQEACLFTVVLGCRRQGAHLWQLESCGDNPGSLALAASFTAVREQSLRPSPAK